VGRSPTWLACGVASAILWASYVPAPARGRLDAFAPFTQLLAVRPALATGLALIAAAGLALTRGRIAAGAPFLLLLLCAALAWAQMAPRAISDAPADAEAQDGITVLTANTLRSSVAPRVIVGLVRRTDADVVSLPETNALLARRIARALTAGGDERWQAFDDRVTRPDDERARPTSLVVRAALGARRLPEGARAPHAHGQVRVRLTRMRTRSGRRGGPALVAVHALPPAPVAKQQHWRRDVLALRPLCRAGWVVVGDLNATLDHSPMHALRDAGCADAGAATGQGLKTTWVAGPLGVFRLVIDHVLTSGRWRATASGVLPIAGSDHRAVWARIAERRPG